MIDNRRDDLVELPSDCEPQHICTPRYGLKGDRCWCQPRSLVHVQLEQSLRQMDNVVELADVRRRRAK